MVEHFELGDIDNQEAVEEFNKAMEKMAKSYTNDGEDYAQIVATEALEEVYARLQAVEGKGEPGLDHNGKGGEEIDESEADASCQVRVIDAFSMPWLVFDGEKKTFQHRGSAGNSGSSNGHSHLGNKSDGSNPGNSRKKPSLAGAAESKAQYLRDRYNILKQIILRNEHFSPPALPGHDRENYMRVGEGCHRVDIL